MPTSAIEAIQTQIYGRLTENTEVWGNEAHEGEAPAYLDPDDAPYVVFEFLGGPTPNQTRVDDARITYAITGASTDPGTASTMAARFNVLFDDTEVSDPFATADGWRIASVTGGLLIYINGVTEDGKRVYIEGRQFVFQMEVE